MATWFDKFWVRLKTTLTNVFATKLLVVRGDNKGGIYMVPTQPDVYNSIHWKDKDGFTVAKLVAHEISDDGKYHQHFSIYTCGEDFSRHIGRMDFQYGRNVASVSVENAIFRIGGKAHLSLRSPGGKYFKVGVTDKGELTIEKEPWVKEEFADKDTPFVTKPGATTQ